MTAQECRAIRERLEERRQSGAIKAEYDESLAYLQRHSPELHAKIMATRAKRLARAERVEIARDPPGESKGWSRIGDLVGAAATGGSGAALGGEVAGGGHDAKGTLTRTVSGKGAG